MTHRSLVALCITVCVGMFTEPHRVDADEVQNQKQNDKTSNALAKVLQVQEHHRSQVQSIQLEQILVLDEAISSIEGDINEFRKYEVRSRDRGPRFFKTDNEKKAKIQSLEHVRDGWKATLKGREAILSACVTSPIWTCQIPIEDLSLGNFGQFHSSLRDQEFFEGMTLPRRKEWTPEMMPRTRSAVGTPKTQKSKGQPTLAASNEETRKRALYQQADSTPLNYGFNTSKSKRWNCTVIDIKDEHNVIVAVSDPGPVEDYEQNWKGAMARYDDALFRYAKDENPQNAEDVRRAIAVLAKLESVKEKVRIKSEPKPLWIRGVPTKGMVNGASVTLTQTLFMHGGDAYQDAAGERSAIPTAEVINLDELESAVPKRPTVDEYLASDTFSEFQKTREAQAAARLNQRSGLPAAEKTVSAPERKSDNKKASASLGSDEKTAADRVLFAKKFIELRKYDAAKKNLKEVIEEYPQTRARMEANQLLKSLPK